jgi:hypothetical protein
MIQMYIVNNLLSYKVKVSITKISKVKLSLEPVIILAIGINCSSINVYKHNKS